MHLDVDGLDGLDGPMFCRRILRHVGSFWLDSLEVLVLMDFYFPEAPLPLKTAVASTAAQQKSQRCQAKHGLMAKGINEQKMKKNEENILIYNISIETWCPSLEE